MDDQVESYRIFSFSEEADELQTPIFELESLDQLQTVAHATEETKEWGQNGILHNASLRIREIRSLVVDEIGKISSRVMSPPRSCHCIPSSTQDTNGRNSDDTTMNSTVSSFQHGSTMHTPSGYTSASASNASSVQPTLYSAIGSLEKCSANSFGQVKIQHKAMSGRDFDRPVAIQQALIPPVSSKLFKGQETNAFKSTLVNENMKGRNIESEGTKVSSENDRKKSEIDKLGTYKNTKTIRRNHNVDGVRTEPKTEKATLKKVTIKDSGQIKSKKPVEMFRPSCDAYTPRMEKKKIKYKPAEMRTTVQKMSSTMGTLARPNFRDALRRVAMILQQHIIKIERRFEHAGARFLGDNLFQASMRDVFSEGKYSTPRYKCTIVRIPMARPGMVYGLREVHPIYSIPSESEIYDFGHQLFKSVQLSSECSIVCLIYLERLMEVAKVSFAKMVFGSNRIIPKVLKKYS